MNKFYHPYHLVSESPWPLMSSLSLMVLMLGSIKLFYLNYLNLFFIGFLLMLMILIQWWRDVVRESTYQGNHLIFVSNGLRLGMGLFILSEVMFFISFFWTYFHMFLAPSIEIGMLWPPKSVLIFNPFNIPLLNTIILLSSGVTITWSHYLILNNMLGNSMKMISITLFLGVLFMGFQYLEYTESYFSMMDSVYGSIFFLVTGFHGFHVFLGIMFIFITFCRIKMNHFSNFHHFGFEAASWYWHFVDVVWLFLFVFIYWLSYYFIYFNLN